MADYKLLTWVIIMFSINAVLWLAQGALAEVGSDAVIFEFEGSPASTFISGHNTTPSFTANADDLDIETSDTVSEESGNIFTDTFKTVKNWITGSFDSGFGFVKAIFGQPYGFLKDIGTPPPISAAFALIWYTVGALLFIGFIRGSNQ